MPLAHVKAPHFTAINARPDQFPHICIGIVHKLSTQGLRLTHYTNKLIPNTSQPVMFFITGKYHVKQIILTLSSQTGISALILAAGDGHTYTVVELVKAGAKLDLQDKVELTTPTSQSQLPSIDPFNYHSHCLHSVWRLSYHQSYSGTSTSHSEGASEGRE